MLKSTAITLSTTAQLVCVGQNENHEVQFRCAANTALVGGSDSQTFPVGDPAISDFPISICPLPGEEIYAKSSSGTPVLHVLESGLSETPSL